MGEEEKVNGNNSVKRTAERECIDREGERSMTQDNRSNGVAVGRVENACSCRKGGRSV